jgi:DNA primase
MNEQQICQATDIIELISEYFPLHEHGGEFRAICPFHPEKSPSFSVSPSKQSFYCHGCGQGGDIFGFLMTYHQIGFADAVKRLRDRAEIR